MAWRVERSETFHKWLTHLRDRAAAATIAQRITRLGQGLLGDAKSVGGGVSEMRIDVGPGYRVYFTRRGTSLIMLLCGGDKASQARDIKRARALAKDL